MNYFVTLQAERFYDMINIYEKLGNYSLDVSKYVLTGFVLASFFKVVDEGYTLYIVGCIVVLLFMAIAIWAFKIQNKVIEKQKK